MAKALRTNSGLRTLNLSMLFFLITIGNNKLGDKGAKEIANGLMSNSALGELNVSENQIGNEGAVELSALLRANATVTSLILGSFSRM